MRWSLWEVNSSLARDHAGNLTDDGVLLYTYDAWNRLVAARRRVDAQTPVAAYEYDGLNRRIRKQVGSSGVGVVPGSDAGGIDGIQAGNLNEHYYYAGWRVIEERDNSAFCVAQTVYGTEYIDAPVCRDRNTDVTAGGSPDDDCLDSGGSAEYLLPSGCELLGSCDEPAWLPALYLGVGQLTWILFGLLKK